LKVGVNTIKTNTSIDGKASVVSVLEEIVGKGNVEVFEGRQKSNKSTKQKNISKIGSAFFIL
jgi:hypothetical protein